MNDLLYKYMYYIVYKILSLCSGVQTNKQSVSDEKFKHVSTEFISVDLTNF